jgi:hypothetical protein
MKMNDDGKGGVKGETLFFFLRRDEVVQHRRRERERETALLTKSNSEGKEENFLRDVLSFNKRCSSPI